MQDLVKVAIIENEIEAGLLASVLRERGIPHLVRTYHDSAYNGLFQTQMGWGDICAPETYAQEIVEILLDLRAQARLPLS